MLKNNKGFMLIEVVITSTIVIVSLIALYTSFNNLYNNYRIRNSYYNLDATYATKEMINLMLKENNILNNSESLDIIKNANCEESLDGKCEPIKSLYKINQMTLIKYSELTNDLTNCKKNLTNITFQEYLDYIITYYDINLSNSDDYNYIVLTEIQDGDNYYYANLRVR